MPVKPRSIAKPKMQAKPKVNLEKKAIERRQLLEQLRSKKVILKKAPVARRPIPERLLTKMVAKGYGIPEREINTRLELLKENIKSYKKDYRGIREVKDLDWDRRNNTSLGGNNIEKLLKLHSFNHLNSRKHLLVRAGYKPIEVALSLAIFEATARKAGLERYPGDNVLSNRLSNPSLKREPANFREAPGYESFIRNHTDWRKVTSYLKAGKFKNANFKELFYEGSLELLSTNF